jgi:hypothetical protein
MIYVILFSRGGLKRQYKPVGISGMIRDHQGKSKKPYSALYLLLYLFIYLLYSLKS